MTDASIEETIATLTQESPSYESLLDVYHELQAPTDGSPESTVCRRALAQVVGEIIDYLDYVSDELEKTFGLTRGEERRRVLAALEPSADGDAITQTHSLVTQWDEIDTYDGAPFHDASIKQ